MIAQPKSGYFCFFTKLELSSFESTNKQDWMILESNAEPGYYSKANFPINERHRHDHHLYIVVKKAIPCFQDMVLRKSGEIIREHKLSMNASPGQLTLFSSTYQCIRIRARELDQIYPLIDGLRLAGIEFLKHKKVSSFSSFVQHKKYIHLEMLSEGVFLDTNEPNRYFVLVPHPLDYTQFEKLIEDIKYSCKYNHFDASLAYLNQGDQTFDFIEVYSDHCHKDKLKEFKEHIDRLVK